MWRQIQCRKLGHHFRRQYPVKRPDTLTTYFLDFYCAAAKLCVEVDGEVHDFHETRDQDRDAWLLSEGIETFRVRTFLLGDELTVVLAKIKELCYARAAEFQHPKKPGKGP